ncbi:MAG: phage shock protein PspA [Inquilinus sp.]|nr:phage shock protein PspA [Inquilinus sp.]
MGVFSRLADIVNSNLNAMLDRAEDPEKIVRLIIQEMEDTLVEVRSAAAKSIADKKELSRKIDQFQAAQADWRNKAELAVQKGRDDLAKGALLAKTRAAETVEALQRELAVIDEALAKADTDMVKLQAKLVEAKNKQKSMDIRSKSAHDRLRMRTHLHDGRIDDALARYESIERKLDEIEGKVDAYDLGTGKKSLADEFSELEAESGIEAELAEIRSQFGRRTAKPAGSKPAELKLPASKSGGRRTPEAGPGDDGQTGDA